MCMRIPLDWWPSYNMDQYGYPSLDHGPFGSFWYFFPFQTFQTNPWCVCWQNLPSAAQTNHAPAPLRLMKALPMELGSTDIWRGSVCSNLNSPRFLRCHHAKYHNDSATSSSFWIPRGMWTCGLVLICVNTRGKASQFTKNERSHCWFSMILWCPHLLLGSKAKSHWQKLRHLRIPSYSQSHHKKSVQDPADPASFYWFYRHHLWWWCW